MASRAQHRFLTDTMHFMWLFWNFRRRYWPQEDNPWAEGLITDYREDTEEHCIVYNINTPDEAFEWFRIK